jgi:hypothetical protein
MPIGLCGFPHCLNNTVANYVLVVWFMLGNQKLNYLEELKDLSLQIITVYLNLALSSRYILQTLGLAIIYPVYYEPYVDLVN